MDAIDQSLSVAFGAIHDMDSLSAIDWPSIDSALSHIYSNGFGIVVADLLQRKLFTLFEQRVLEMYYAEVKSSPAAALKLVHEGYMNFLGIVKRFSEKLRAPTLLSQFSAAVRGGLLHPREGATNHVLHLMTFLRGHGRDCLAKIEDSALRRDEVLLSLHWLTLAHAKEIKLMWQSMLEAAIKEEAKHVVDGDVPKRVSELLLWKEKVVDSFSRLVLSRNERDLATKSDTRAELDDWSQHFEVVLVSECASQIIASFFNLVVDFPESAPILRDLRFCLRRTNCRALHELLSVEVKSMLAMKLQHAGARTEDILTVLVATIRSLCMLYSKNEQGPVVLDIIADTLGCLQRRKDSVAALVNEVTQASSDGSLFTHSKGHDGDSDDEEDEVEDSSQPNVLKLLLNALSLQEIVRQYKSTLAESILQHDDFDCTSETEVLERMKRVFGEDVLSQCDVMLRDIQQSRRIKAWINEQSSSRQKTTAAIISHTCWPSVEEETQVKFKPHSRLEAQMEAYNADFKRMKPNQTLKWIPTLGSVNISIKLKAPDGAQTPKSFKLSLLQASAVLHLKENGGTLKAAVLAEKLGTKEDFLLSRLSAFSPSLFVITTDSKEVRLQTEEIGSSAFAYKEEEAASEIPSGMTAKESEMYTNMVCAMVKTGGKKSAQQIENSMKMFGKFAGTSEDVKAFLLYLVKQEKISTTDMTTFGPVVKR